MLSVLYTLGLQYNIKCVYLSTTDFCLCECAAECVVVQRNKKVMD